MTTPTQTTETEIVQGTVVGIIQKKPDTWQVAVQPPGSQYNKNLWTKDQALVAQLSQMIGSQQSFLCGASTWFNPRVNQEVRSLWINGVGPGVAQQATPLPQPAMASAAPGPTMQDNAAFAGMQTMQPQMPPQAPQPPLPSQPVAWDGAVPTPAQKELRIMREAASKVAAILMGYLPPEVPRNYDTFLTLCNRLVANYEHGFGQPAFSHENAPPEFDGYQHSDDDVPF